MSVPTINFFHDEWQTIPSKATHCELTMTALPPVAASVGIVLFSKAAGGSAWFEVDRAKIDNIAATPIGPKFRWIVSPSMDYVLRFQGEAHLLMPSFGDIELKFDVVTNGGALITDFGGRKTENNTRMAGINGLVYLKKA